jgi:hypothetical protein
MTATMRLVRAVSWAAYKGGRLVGKSSIHIACDGSRQTLCGRAIPPHSYSGHADAYCRACRARVERMTVQYVA